MVKLKRAYDKPAKTDGRRFLVERLWPRGIRKEDLPFEAWLKDAAPSTELRKWFSHDVAKWPEFRRRYRKELETHDAVLAPLRAAAQKGTVTLVYGSRDTEHNAAVALRDYLAGTL